MSAENQEQSGEPIHDLATRMLIEDFFLEYAHVIDDGEYSRWPDYFTEAGFYQIIARESYEAGLPVGILTCDGRGMMIDRMKALAEANIYEPHGYCHFLNRPSLWQTAPAEFSARSNFNIVRTMQNGDQSLFVTGKYLDQLTIEDNKPLLRERKVVLDSRRIDILLVLPL